MKECVTHHCSCECREELVREMCRYLLWADDHPDEPDSAVFAAILIAKELYPTKAEAK